MFHCRELMSLRSFCWVAENLASSNSAVLPSRKAQSFQKQETLMPYPVTQKQFKFRQTVWEEPSMKARHASDFRACTWPTKRGERVLQPAPLPSPAHSEWAYNSVGCLAQVPCSPPQSVPERDTGRSPVCRSSRYSRPIAA